MLRCRRDGSVRRDRVSPSPGRCRGVEVEHVRHNIIAPASRRGPLIAAQ